MACWFHGMPEVVDRFWGGLGDVFLRLYQKILLLALIGTLALFPALMLVNVSGLKAQTIKSQVPQSDFQIKLSFAPILAKVTPAVVNVYAKAKRETYPISEFLSQESFFNEFFRNKSNKSNKSARRWRALGAGVIVRKDGIIVTNNHVIENTSDIKVVLPDSSYFKARILYSNPRNDIAILAINSKRKNFPIVKIADSDNVQVGDLVLAIGNPFGIGQSVTSGIVSARSRAKRIGKTYGSFIQTDAAINPGNSGGALIDINGELIGINSAIYTKKSGSLGIGFAIPTNFVKRILQAVYRGKEPQYPYLGAVFQNLTASWAKLLKLAYTKGIVIAAILENSILDKAGMQEGDVLLEVDGVAIENTEHLNFRLFSLGIGHVADFRFYRKGKFFNKKIRLATSPKSIAYQQKEEVNIENKSFFSGITIADISPKLVRALSLPRNTKGVVITNVKPLSNAETIGLRTGDVIRSVSNRKINNKKDFVRATKFGKIIRTTIERSGRRYNIILQKR